MIGLATSQHAAIERAIAGAVGRLALRASAHGDGARALTEALAATTADGKRLRPALVIASFEAFGGREDDAPGLWQVAAAFELLHSAFLIHDDLIDRDLERRGAPNVAGLFHERARRHGADERGARIVADAASILAGDLLLFEAARTIATAPLEPGVRGELLDVLDEAVLVSAVGELADAEHAARADCPDPDALLAAAHDKTAVYSFRAPLRAGAILAGASPQVSVSAAAAELGLAYQLVDDLIGTFGTPAQAGRAPGSDLRESKRTPLVALARESASWPAVRSALVAAPTGPVAVVRAQRAIEASGARRGLEDLVRERLDRARAHARSADLPMRASVLLADLAGAIEARIP